MDKLLQNEVWNGSLPNPPRQGRMLAMGQDEGRRGAYLLEPHQHRAGVGAQRAHLGGNLSRGGKTDSNMTDKKIKIGAHTVELSNLDKVLFPDEGITKGDLIDYLLPAHRRHHAAPSDRTSAFDAAFSGWHYR